MNRASVSLLLEAMWPLGFLCAPRQHVFCSHLDLIPLSMGHLDGTGCVETSPTFGPPRQQGLCSHVDSSPVGIPQTGMGPWNVGKMATQLLPSRGSPERGRKSKWLHNPCHHGGRMWAKWQHNPCRLGDPQKGGRKSKRLHNPSHLGGPNVGSGYKTYAGGYCSDCDVLLGTRLYWVGHTYQSNVKPWLCLLAAGPSRPHVTQDLLGGGGWHNALVVGWLGGWGGGGSKVLEL